MIVPPFERVMVDADVAHLSFSRRFLRAVEGSVPVAVLEPGSPVPKGNRTVHLTREPGAFVKPCPCSPGAVRCGYWVLTPALQCPFACTYCFLRFYAPDAPLTLYANLEDAERQFREAAARWEGPVRLGTGEFSDSLALDPWTRHARWLTGLVAPHPNVVLELKTKSARVESLLESAPAPNVVVAWSVNPSERVASDEPGSADLEERLRAASSVAAAGYRVGFHLDPIIYDEGWEAAYRDLIGRIFEAVDPMKVAWVSLGTLRFPGRFLDRWGPTLRGKSIFFQEFLPSEDGKLRYFWPLRREMNRQLARELRRAGGAGLRVYLCMESERMWAAALGWVPASGDVERYLTEPAGIGR